MKTPAWFSAAAPDYDHFETGRDDDIVFGELLPGERIGTPHAGSGKRVLLRNSLVISSLLGGGWFLLGDRITWSDWRPSGIAALQPPADPKPARPAEPAATPAGAVPEAVAIAPPSPAARLETAALPPAATAYAEPAAEPLRPPKADPSDPNQVRAAAIGLNPELSRAVLAQLSAVDYKNAGTAIKTALAETPDDAVYTWPSKPEPGQAVFEVHFVPGAATGCRRYVVTVAKLGWASTALPMEKCGIKVRAARKE